MELDVTHMVEDSDNMYTLSGSPAEWGKDAGRFTWDNSMEYGKNKPLLSTDDARDAARRHFREYGAWSEEEIAAWSDAELQGITCQDVAGAIRELDSYADTDAYQQASERGEASGRLYPSDGRWYFHLGC